MKTIVVTVILTMNSLLSFAQCFNETNSYSFNYDGHTYKIIKENKTWTSASNCAVSTSGYLAEIESAAEENAIFSALVNDAGIDETFTQNEFGTAAVWIGGSDSQNEGIWIWDGDNDNNGAQFWNGDFNGSPVNGAYTNWGTLPTEPDNSGDQDKLTLTIDSNHPNYGKWNDLADISFNTLYYVIEYDFIVDVEERLFNDKIKIYPNPFNDFIYIDSQLGMSQIRIFNNMGQMLYEQSSPLDETKIKLTSLKNGVYFLNIILQNGRTITYKITR